MWKENKRRAFTALFAAVMALSAFAAPRLAFQVYAVRELCEKDFPGTLKAAKAMGFDGVETGRFYGLDAKGLKAACDARLQELGLNSWVGDHLHSTVQSRISKVGCSVVQNGVELPEGARVENSILFAGAAVQAGETVKDEIRGRGFSWKL
jgi:sugar phosphate isomerase/epimerase